MSLRASQLANTCERSMLPGSRVPEMRDPMTKSASPSRTGVANRTRSEEISLPSPSIKASTSLVRLAAWAPLQQAWPYPRRGSRITNAPLRCASSAVASVLPLSTTMHSAKKSQGNSRSVGPIASASFERRDDETHAAEFHLEAPAQAAVRTGTRRLRTHQARSKVHITVAIPYLAKGLSRGVSEGEAVIAMHGKRCDTAR